MKLGTIEFGSLLSYSPRGAGTKAEESRQTMYAIKYDRMHRDAPMSEYIARVVAKKLGALPFAEFFAKSTVLVPAPKSARARPGSLWVPQRLACSMEKHGLGVRAECLVRETAVPKSATSPPRKRPKPRDHYASMKVTDILDDPPGRIVIVDDVITRGSTLIGAANKLAEAFPNARIRGLAALRTISNPDEFKDVFDPCVGTIAIRDDNAFARCHG